MTPQPGADLHAAEPGVAGEGGGVGAGGEVGTQQVELVGTAFVALIAVLYPSLVPAIGIALAAFTAMAVFLKP